MRMRPIPGAAVAFAATLAATVASPGPAEAFFFLPIFQQQSQPSIDSRSSRSDNNRWRGQGEGRGRPAQIIHRDPRETRRGEVEFLGQERKVAGEIRVQLPAGLAHAQRSSGAASEQEQRPRQRLGAPGKPRGRRQYALRRAAGPAQRPHRERRRAGAQFRPRRQHPRRYLRREARRGVQGADRRDHQAVELAGRSRSTNRGPLAESYSHFGTSTRA